MRRKLSERQQADALYRELRKPPLTPDQEAAMFVAPPPLGAYVAGIRDGMVAEQDVIDAQRGKDLPDLWGGGETNG